MVKAIDQALTLVPVIKPKAVNPVTQRRNRLLKAIRKQQAALEQFKLGEKTDRVWFWSNEDGTIQCNTLDDVAKNLGLVESLIHKGELDHVLTLVSRDIRARFGKQN
jgi:hypothetical protein